ncbi:MAG: ribonuclease P protein component [Erythrobacter sp.]|nr:ribonuclease P protein component [Erythrobacter sp.]NCQ64228.1 ribonuclease P protein component [Alphaproteobacteria bacterium]
MSVAEATAHARSADRRITSHDVLTRRADFLAANRGLRVPTPGFVLLVRPNEGQGMRYGITVTKKIGNAVVRNRMKRRLRELLWAQLGTQGLPDHDHVLIGRESGIERDFTKLSSELTSALARAARGEGQRGRPPRGRRRR